MDGGAWWDTVHGVAKSRTQLSNFTSLSDVIGIRPPMAGIPGWEPSVRFKPLSPGRDLQL